MLWASLLLSVVRAGSSFDAELYLVHKKCHEREPVDPIRMQTGLIASPVCLWSEYTLATTGAGLPEGPGGALGALEGMSYLVVVGMVAWSAYTKVRRANPIYFLSVSYPPSKFEGSPVLCPTSRFSVSCCPEP